MPSWRRGAQEDDEIERIFGKKGKKKKQEDTQLLLRQAQEFLADMEARSLADTRTLGCPRGGLRRPHPAAQASMGAR